MLYTSHEVNGSTKVEMQCASRVAEEREHFPYTITPCTGMAQAKVNLFKTNINICSPHGTSGTTPLLECCFHACLYSRLVVSLPNVSKALHPFLFAVSFSTRWRSLFRVMCFSRCFGYLRFLLLMSGDVERNPGPTTKELGD